MKLKQYKEKRAELYNKAVEAIDNGKIEDSKKFREQITQLDKDFENAATEQAELNALKDNVNVDIVTEVKPQNLEVIMDQDKFLENHEKDYRNIFARVTRSTITGKNPNLSKNEVEIFNKFNPQNEYIHTTENTNALIPKSVQFDLEDKFKEIHPVLQDIKELKVTGLYSVPKRVIIEEGEAKFYLEDTATEFEKNDFPMLNLAGKEVAKLVAVSWKLEAMSTEEFLDWLEDELVEEISRAKARAYVRGLGDDREPQGVITALEAQKETPQVVKYKGELTYDILLEGLSKIAKTANTKIYVGNIYSTVARLKDGAGNSIFQPSAYREGSVGSVLGSAVYEDSELKAGEILIGDFKNGYVATKQNDIELRSARDVIKRHTYITSYQVIDGGVRDERAFAYIAPGVDGGAVEG